MCRGLILRLQRNFYRFLGLAHSPYERTVYLDNDVFVVHPGFFSGLRLASAFGGISFAVQDRSYWTSMESFNGKGRRYNVGDLHIGLGIGDGDRALAKVLPPYLTAVHMLPAWDV